MEGGEINVKKRDDRTSAEETLEVFRYQILERLATHGLGNGDRGSRESCRSTCEKVWVKFSQIHQKSPSHKNNNVQNCRYKDRVGLAPVSGSSVRVGTIKGENLWRVVTGPMGFCWIVLQFFFCLLLVLASVYCVIVLHKPTELFLTRYSQDFIYPIMRFLRLVSLPYVRRHPGSTKIYGDPCLIRNPFFAVYVDCWPCESSKSIIDLTGFSNFSTVFHGIANPFIVKDAFNKYVGFEDIRAIAYEDDELLKQLFLGSGRSDFSMFKSAFDRNPAKALSKETLHAEWEINRASSVRMLRKYFPKPYFIPNSSEVSMQHFLFVDQSMSPSYTLPITEFANVFLTQASGTRHVVLFPADTCKNLCKPLSVLLQPKDVLGYFGDQSQDPSSPSIRVPS